MSLPEYDGKTFGVISLVGDEQALKIESLLRTHLTASDFAKRRITVGNPAQFQGDERDVMFLSMVDAPDVNGPLGLRNAGPRDMFKKRYNVAVSRAKDQLWVVFSLDPETDLKPGDLRQRLIKHALNPDELSKLMEDAVNKVGSPFETEIYNFLVQNGFEVKCQWPVGHYFIDLVVSGVGKRIAIECDGDRFHPPEQLVADMERQAVLQRLGWKFIRIRGSEFYRRKESTLKNLLGQLERAGIQPALSASGLVSPFEHSELLSRVKLKASEFLDSAV
jgi:very-short-patch-repair endonuclease